MIAKPLMDKIAIEFNKMSYNLEISLHLVAGLLFSPVVFSWVLIFVGNSVLSDEFEGVRNPPFLATLSPFVL